MIRIFGPQVIQSGWEKQSGYHVGGWEVATTFHCRLLQSDGHDCLHLQLPCGSDSGGQGLGRAYDCGTPPLLPPKLVAHMMVFGSLAAPDTVCTARCLSLIQSESM